MKSRNKDSEHYFFTSFLGWCVCEYLQVESRSLYKRRLQSLWVRIVNRFIISCKEWKISFMFIKHLTNIWISRAVKENVKRAIADHFGLDSSSLYLTHPTFFSRIDATPARTMHDEYWHDHVDKVKLIYLHWDLCFLVLLFIMKNVESDG